MWWHVCKHATTLLTRSQFTLRGRYALPERYIFTLSKPDGGERKNMRGVLDAFSRLHGRVPVCGMIGQYNDADHPHGVKTLWQLVVNRIKMQGFITYDYPDVLEQAQRELDGWVAEGKLKPLANVRDGFEKLPEAFIDLMSGRTIGKTIVRI